MEKSDNLELIQKYFRNELNPEEQQAFHQLEHDPGFQEELAAFEFLHDLLEAGSLMEEEEVSLDKAATEPSLNEPRFGTGEQSSLSKQIKVTEEEEKMASKPIESHKQPRLQLRFPRVVRYAIAASVLLLLIAGLTLYLNYRPGRQEKITATAPLMTNAPLIASISYREESDDLVRDLQIPDTTFTVKIYPPSDRYKFHYHFRGSDTLRLYGEFNPKDLMLTYYASRMEYQLTYKDNTYLLERNKEMSPLIPAAK